MLGKQAKILAARDVADLLAFADCSRHPLRTGDHDTFQYDEGLVAFVKYLNRASEPVHPEVVYIRSQTEEADVEVALQYSGEYTENVHTFVNNINTEMGGTHLQGFRLALRQPWIRYHRGLP